MDAAEAIALVRPLLDGEPVVLAGSAVTAQVYDKRGDEMYNDVDGFVRSQVQLGQLTERALENGAVLPPKELVKWRRWLRYGADWKTNTIRVITKEGVELNLTYKKEGMQPIRFPHEVCGSFDIGHSAVAIYGLNWDYLHDFREGLFPWAPDLENLGLIMTRQEGFADGFIGKHLGPRQGPRIGVHGTRGYTMTVLREEMIQGYTVAAENYLMSFDQDSDEWLLAQIYLQYVELAEQSDWQRLAEAKKWVYEDDLATLLRKLD